MLEKPLAGKYKVYETHMNNIVIWEIKVLSFIIDEKEYLYKGQQKVDNWCNKLLKWPKVDNLLQLC